MACGCMRSRAWGTATLLRGDMCPSAPLPQVTADKLKAYYPSDEKVCAQLDAGMALAQEHVSCQILDGSRSFSRWDVLTTAAPPATTSPNSGGCTPLLRGVRLTAAQAVVAAAMPTVVRPCLATDLSVFRTACCAAMVRTLPVLCHPGLPCLAQTACSEGACELYLTMQPD